MLAQRAGPPQPGGPGGRRTKVSRDVDLPGFVPRPLALLSHAFALSSRYKGFGNVIVETLACDCPLGQHQLPLGAGEDTGVGAFRQASFRGLAGGPCRSFEEDARATARLGRAARAGEVFQWRRLLGNIWHG